jgi:hypothetical protein
VTPGEFAAKWRGVETSERASAQSHFLDLCALLGEPGPTEADPTGSWYAFEKGAEKLDGRDGFADVWKKGHFAWEYKGKRKDLKAAYRQLVDYKDALENPPLLVVSDLERIEVRTNFTSLSPKLYRVTLDDLGAADPSEALRVLRAVFTEPEALRPTWSRDAWMGWVGAIQEGILRRDAVERAQDGVGPIGEAVGRQPGSTLSSSSETRRSSARSCSAAALATSTSRTCSPCSAIGSRGWLISVRTGTRRHERRSPPARRNALDSSQRRASVVVAVA